MASEVATGSVNGVYGTHPGYPTPDPSQLSSSSRAADNSAASMGHTNEPGNKPSAGHDAPGTAKQEKKPDVPKDEVGWFFVEQYYTTLSKSPEKLHVGPQQTHMSYGQANRLSSSTTKDHSFYQV